MKITLDTVWLSRFLLPLCRCSARLAPLSPPPIKEDYQMTPTTWAEIACTVPDDMVDPLAAYLVEVTGSGVTIDNLTLDTFSLDTLQDSPVKTVRGYAPADE